MHVDTLSAPDRIRIRRVSGRGVVPADTVVVARDGVAWPTSRRVGTMPRAVRFQAIDTVRSPGATRVLRSEFALTSVAPGPPLGATSWPSCRKEDRCAMRPAPASPIRPALDQPRRLRDAARRRAGAPRTAPRGLPTLGVDSAAAPAFVRRAVGGALQGRRITLDPEGGGGTRRCRSFGHARVNLNSRRRASSPASCARRREVRLTREGDYASPRSSASRAAKASAPTDISESGTACDASATTIPAPRAAAGRTQPATFASLGLGARDRGGGTLPLQQTSCPALYASRPRSIRPATRRRCWLPGPPARRGLCLFLGLAGSGRRRPIGRWIRSSSATGRSAGSRVLVTLGEAIALESDGPASSDSRAPSPDRSRWRWTIPGAGADGFARLDAGRRADRAARGLTGIPLRP